MSFRLNAAVLAAATLLAAPAFAADCEATIESNDAMQFNLKTMAVPKSCKQFKLTLKHVGKMAKATMGHNWVLSRTADLQGIANDGIAAGLAKEFLKAGDTRVIAATKLIGGGENTSVDVDVSKLKAGESYTYFCSFPGHSGIMKGTLTLGS